MNRKKKIYEKFAKRVKKANAKRNPGNKPRYISKAERETEFKNLESSDTHPENPGHI